MQKTIFLVLAVILLTLASCKKASQSSGSLSLQVNPMFGNNAFKIGSTYESPDKKYYYFSNLQMYLSNIKLLHADGSSIQVCPVAYIGPNNSINFTPAISLTNANGSFSGIQFSIGLDPTQDNTPVNTTDPSSPFYTNNGMYWDDTTLKYVFVKLEGYADTNKIPATLIGYHIGTQTYYTTVTIDTSFTLSGMSATTLNLNMDIQRIFYGGSNPINVLNPNEQSASSNPKPALCQQFITNLDSAFYLQQ